MSTVVPFPRGGYSGAGLFRPKIRHMLPSPRGGADRKYEGISEDGLSWMLKLGDTPCAISEWLGYKISEVCQIGVPHHDVVELPGGGFAFGSRIEGGLESLGNDSPVIVNVVNNRDPLSRIYALDLAISNDDRHPSNILWRKNGLGVLVPMSVDFGNALLMQGWPLPDIMSRDCNTTQQIRLLRHISAWNGEVAAKTLLTVRDIPQGAVADWIDRAPQDWIGDLDRNRLIRWWGSEAFQTRMNDCIMFCT